MSPAASGTPENSNYKAWPTTVSSLAVGIVFFTLWFWLLPSWLGFRIETAGAARWRWIAAIHGFPKKLVLNWSCLCRA